MMREEQVTKAILKWLTENYWQIVCFDFPQSGTGILLHPNSAQSEKNKDGFIPDIVAVKDSTSLFFENKDRFYYPDYQKINNLIVSDEYSIAINELLGPYHVNEIYYGIGLPTNKHSKRSDESKHLVDFILGVNGTFSIDILYNNRNIKMP